LVKTSVGHAFHFVTNCRFWFLNSSKDQGATSYSFLKKKIRVYIYSCWFQLFQKTQRINRKTSTFTSVSYLIFHKNWEPWLHINENWLFNLLRTAARSFFDLMNQWVVCGNFQFTYPHTIKTLKQICYKEDMIFLRQKKSWFIMTLMRSILWVHSLQCTICSVYCGIYYIKMIIWH
jgi:hypothetical protein